MTENKRKNEPYPIKKIKDRMKYNFKIKATLIFLLSIHVVLGQKAKIANE
jgi:hypothetical protein